MKSLLVGFFLFSSTLALGAPCPDFVGKYISTNRVRSQIDMTITQKACESVRMTYDSGGGFVVNHTHIFDGKKRLVETGDDFEAYETCSIGEKGMKIDEEDHISDLRKREVKISFVKILVFFTAPGKLVITKDYFDDKGNQTNSLRMEFEKVRR